MVDRIYSVSPLTYHFGPLCLYNGQHLEELQNFWSTMNEIDRALWVEDPKQPSLAASYRQINVGEVVSYKYIYSIHAVV